MPEATGKLYLIPSPIGNLGDISNRALECLRECDLVACEDTRTTGRLLAHFEIKKPLVSYHEYNERARADKLRDELLQGKTIAVVSDAGTPGISDPAYRVVRSALEAGIAVSALPGANALLPALTASGLPTDRFFFEGFLPVKSGARKTRLTRLKELEHTLVFYESPHRLLKSLNEMREVLGNRPACVAREISKRFEEFVRGDLDTVRSRFATGSVKGEIVVVIAGNNPKLWSGDD